MAGDLLLYIGSVIIFAWGIAHIAPVGGVVRGFEGISESNRRIITMTWVSEGLFLCFIGAVVFLVVTICDTDIRCARVVVLASAVMLFLGAIWTAITGARTPVLPMKLCPITKLVVAACFVLGALI